MIKFTIAFMLLLVIEDTYSQERVWIKLAATPDKAWDAMRYNSPEGTRAKLWLRKGAKEILYHDSTGMEIKLVDGIEISLNEFECEKGLYRMLNISDYNSAGKLVRKKYIYIWDQKWIEIKLGSGSIADKMFNCACK
ncbi:MAG: hypothetical protein ABWZ25_08705 [Chitinophagaceae bacterium]